uniref:Uncharacterized protein n=1 Tax=Rhizophora mucronata TaxID=61149 RepID=A0A2P2PTU0_RHIMU
MLPKKQLFRCTRKQEAHQHSRSYYAIQSGSIPKTLKCNLSSFLFSSC